MTPATRRPRSSFSALRKGAGFGPVIARVATASVVASLLLVSGQQASSDRPFSDRASSDGGSATEPLTIGAESLAPVSASSCADVLVVGIDGNGQGRGSKYGLVVGAVANKVKAKAAAQNRSVSLARVRASTPGTKVLAAGRARTPSTTAVTAKQARRWQASVRPTTKKTRELVISKMAGCPEQQVLLVGYAQGAGVAHRVLQDLAEANRLGNVAGAILVSDPYLVPGSVSGKPLGKPAAGKSARGISAQLLKSVGDVPAATGTFRVVEVCHRSDLVCNPNKTAAGKAARIAASYSRKGSRSVMEQAAEAAWQQLSLWPDPVEQQLSVTAGQPLSVQLQVKGGSPTFPAAHWTAVALPPGVSLSADGVLSGALDTPGIYQVSFTVAGTSPATSARSGSVLLNAKSESGSLAAGGQSGCEVRADGTAWCWGRNDFGQVGDGTTTLRPAATQVLGADWSRIATGGSTTCGIQRNGTLWCWGLNNFGQLGGADKAGSATPRQVGTSTGWREVSVAWSHACATQVDGTLWCWGQNIRGQLGNGKTASRSTGPVRVVGTQQWASVTAGGWHTCGTAADGSAWCWGENTFGQVGDGTTTLRVRPQRVLGEGSWTQLSAAWGRTCGVLVDGGLRCWGDNATGALGDGTYQDRSTPVGIAGGNNSWAQVATGASTTCASERNGSVWCWGDNRYGQAGPAAGASGNTPVPAGVTSVGALVTAGWLHTCAVSASGPTCWGANDTGQLGVGAQSPPYMPTRAKPTWPKPTVLTKQQVNQWGARKIAKIGVDSRPAVSARQARRKATPFNVMSFNVLGSQHTSPSGARPAYAPGRVRAEWSKQLLAARDASLIGTQEIQPDQVVSFDVATQGAFSFYPGNTQGYPAATQSVMWREADWELLWGSTVSMPFMRDTRPQPVVRLRHRATGAQVYLINVHLSPGGMEAERDKGLEIVVATIKELEGDGVPILLTGDFNEHREAFCKVVGKTDLEAAQGGSHKGGTCKPPTHMRVDWIFGSRGDFSGTSIDQSSRIRRTTDHAVISTRFSVQ